jgi:putative transposase
MTDHKAILTPDGYFHIFNRAVGSEKLFVAPDNYRYFLNRFKKYIAPVSDLFCYSLLPNHFHFFLRIKEENIIRKHIECINLKGKNDFNFIPEFLLQQFSNYFNAYTKAFNKQQNRKGRLFIEPFNRKKVTNTSYYTKLIHYIHANPVHHGFCDKVDDWPYTSYEGILSKHNELVKGEEVISWFGSLEACKTFHEQPIERKFSKVLRPRRF